MLRGSGRVFIFCVALCCAGAWHGRVAYGAALALDTALLRGCVVTLQPLYDGQREEYMDKLCLSLGQHGYRTAADILEDYARGGGFASGVVVAWGARRYVVTSRHALALAQGVMIELGGGAARLAAGEIVYSRGPTDLAVVALPASYQGPGLPLDTADFSLRELAVAGYGGFGGEPYWTFERGHGLLRRRAREHSLYDGARYVESDATLEPGMTGSALLAVEPGSAAGFSLVGVNIWKASLYENRALAVPAAEVVRVLAAVEGEGEGAFGRDALQEAMRTGGAGLGMRLSDGYVSSVPVERVFAEYYEMERGARRRARRAFEQGEAVDGIRYVLADVLSRGYAGEQLRVTSAGVEGDRAIGGGATPVIMAREKGLWRVEELEVPGRLERPRYGFAHAVELRGTARVGVQYPFYAQEGVGLSLQFSYMQWTYFFFQLGGVYGKYGFEVQDPFTDFFVEVRGTYLGLEPSLGVQLPLVLGKTLLLPYARGYYGMHYSLRRRQENFMFFRTYRAVPGLALGLDVACRVREGVYFVGGVEWSYSLIEGNFGAGRQRGSSVGVRVGVGF